MPGKNIPISLAPLSLLVGISCAISVAAEKANVVTFDDHVKPILRQYCLKCHGNDEQNADLNLQHYATLLEGGSAGAVVKAGQADASILYLAITNQDDAARMPPESPPIPAAAIATIRSWINTGLRESTRSKALSAQRTITFSPSATASQKPDGPPAMPAKLPPIALPTQQRPLAILALAASPWAPLAAASGHQHIRLWNTETEQEIGQLPFPEGIPYVLKFSQNGDLLLAAGGQPGHSGSVVLYNVRTGNIVGRFGDELDAVMAADISPDQKIVALGGPGRTVKAYATATGKQLYQLTRHTDWITAIAFSPDGKQIATADRSGNLHLSDASRGGILLSLANHKASIRSVAWRSDSRILTSAGDDGRLIWWDATSGFVAMQNTNAHPPARPAGYTGKLRNGILSVRFRRDGKLVSAGRDHHVRLWKTSSDQTSSLHVETAIPTQVTVDHTGQKQILGDAAGQLRFWQAK
ncbi:MAG: hypothetical protein CL681_09920 [Blastopirellula sp.]|nr:hypothetical protein [Blastopirellula sp.]